MNDLAVVLPYAVLRNNSANTGGRINITMTTDHGPWIADRIAADFNIIAQHGTELFDASFHLLRPVVDDDKFLITLYVGCDGSCSHMAVIAKDAVADIIVMRCLDMVKKDDILQLHGISSDTVGTGQS